LPYEKLYISTHLPYSELSKRLHHITDALRKLRLVEPFFPKKSYYGSITPDGFSIHHWVDHSDTTLFPPVIDGDFLDAKNGEIIVRIRFHLHWTSLLGMFCWLFFYGLVFAILITSLFPDPVRWSDAFVLFAILTWIILTLIFSYATMLALFKSRVRLEKRIFREFTEAYESIESG
jgi:hypothetical protein